MISKYIAYDGTNNNRTFLTCAIIIVKSVGTAVSGGRGLGWKFMSLIYRQELCQLADLASDCTLSSQSGASLLVDTTLDNYYNS